MGLKVLLLPRHEVKSGPVSGNVCDNSDPAAVKPVLLFFFFLPLLQSEFLPFFTNVIISKDILKMAEALSSFLWHQVGADASFSAKLGCPWECRDFFLGTKELEPLWKCFLLWYPHLSLKKKSFKLSFSHQSCIRLSWVKNSWWLVRYLCLTVLFSPVLKENAKCWVIKPRQFREEENIKVLIKVLILDVPRK